MTADPKDTPADADPNQGMAQFTKELEVFKQIHDALLPLKDDATRLRVIRAAAILLNINLRGSDE